MSIDGFGAVTSTVVSSKRVPPSAMINEARGLIGTASGGGPSIQPETVSRACATCRASPSQAPTSTAGSALVPRTVSSQRAMISASLTAGAGWAAAEAAEAPPDGTAGRGGAGGTGACAAEATRRGVAEGGRAQRIGRLRRSRSRVSTPSAPKAPGVATVSARPSQIRLT
ncbi:hypothetical protein NBEOAGPD_5125 [Methylobacterium gregans]|uniref:Uncharacterized protein n=1 Tax=Methylobacterium gregans TaxID=374424 RepID=A0AA37MHA9_9HYPH|nr:hypothetical protein NBEOAGPD_5125 [Methylobacterium gregans]